MTDEFGLTLVPAAHLGEVRIGGGACSGVSFLEDKVVLYAPTASRRQNFTLAHETGHWLLSRTKGFLDWVADHETPAEAIETVCDLIAQRLLLPDESIVAVIGSDVVRARHVMEIYGSTMGSRQVCAIGLAQKLPGFGAVVIINRDTWEVEHASIHPDPEKGWPTVYPWSGQSLPEGSAFRQLATGENFSRLSMWRSPWNSQADFYVDGVADSQRLYLVFSETDLWDTTTGFVNRGVDFVSRPTQTIFCCGKSRTVTGFPCPKCHRSFCPKCGDCACDKRAANEGECASCHNRVLPHLLQDGLCEMCA